MKKSETHKDFEAPPEKKMKELNEKQKNMYNSILEEEEEDEESDSEEEDEEEKEERRLEAIIMEERRAEEERKKEKAYKEKIKNETIIPLHLDNLRVNEIYTFYDTKNPYVGVEAVLKRKKIATSRIPHDRLIYAPTELAGLPRTNGHWVSVPLAFISLITQSPQHTSGFLKRFFTGGNGKRRKNKTKKKKRRKKRKKRKSRKKRKTKKRKTKRGYRGKSPKRKKSRKR